MLVQAITFEIRDFNKGTAENFMVENTEDNYTLIAMRKDTRDIHFVEMFDFQFNREVKCPLFIELGNVVLNSFDRELVDSEYILDTDYAIDDVDEMTGAF